jgi:nicotinate phosphoribosyltransferase
MSEVSALFTDFYELTMAQGYWKLGMDHRAVFDMFFRRQPFGGGFSVFAGLGTLLDALEGFRFQAEDLAYLEGLGIFDRGFIAYLADFRFSGDVWAFPEGSVVFPQEPLLRVHADLIQAQIVEGLVLNTINFQSLIATKTARIALASNGGGIMEFGLRRAQGQDGALSASRAAYIGGAAGTSNTLAGRTFGIPVMGTMAHSWVMSFPSELEAFDAYAGLYPDKTVFLIDTYDTLESGIGNAIEAGRKLAAKGRNFGVRLDSGDVQYLSERVRERLDAEGFPKATITASNELTEQIVQQLRSSRAPIDNWGIGTHMVTGGDEASFTGVYKLAAKEGQGGLEPTMKVSDNPEKSTNPGVKQVWRLYGEDGLAAADILAMEGETIVPGVPRIFHHPSMDYRQFRFVPTERIEAKLVPAMKAGKRTAAEGPLSAIRDLVRANLAEFDGTYKRILNPHLYKVSITEDLRRLKTTLMEGYLKGGG